jgi:WD40 repeat protein
MLGVNFRTFVGTLVAIMVAINASPVLGQNVITGNRMGMQEVNSASPFTRIAASSDGKTVVAIDVQPDFYFWDLATEKVKKLPISGPQWLAISGDGNLILENDGQIWELRKLDAKNKAVPSDNLLGDGEHWWSFGTRGCLQARPRYPVTSAVFFSKDKLLVTASGRRGKPGEVKIWDVKSGKVREPKIDYVPSAFYSSDGSGDILGLPAVLREAPGVQTLAVSADGSTLVTSYVSSKISELGGGTAKLWDLSSGKVKSHILLAERPIHSSCAAPNGKLVAFGVANGKSGEVVVWDVQAGKTKLVAGVHPEPVVSVSFSSTGRFLASACSRVVKIKDLTNDSSSSIELAKDLDVVRALAFTPDERRLIAAGGSRLGWVKSWETQAKIDFGRPAK